MDSDDEIHDYVGETAIDDKQHESLIENVLNLNKVQHVKAPSRKEPTVKVSEFNLVKSITGEKGTVDIDEVTRALKKKKSHVTISKKIQSAEKKAQVLPKPLEKPQAERIKRGVGYEKSKLKLDKWEPIVTANRVSTNLSFPLDDNPKIEIKEATEMTKMWRFKSKLQEKLEKLEPKIETYEIDMEKNKIPKSMSEMIEHRNQMAKRRALESYKESKARRLRKIKSKKYHRIQRRQKIKQHLREFEELKKKDPLAALKKLEDIDKIRAEERFSLRHRSTGKWAKNQQIKAKYDKESRDALAQQLSVNRELTQKLKINEDSDYESEPDREETRLAADDENEEMPHLTSDLDNPWTVVNQEKEVTDFVSKYRTFYNEQNGLAKQKQENNPEQDENNENDIYDHNEDDKTERVDHSKEDDTMIGTSIINNDGAFVKKTDEKNKLKKKRRKKSVLELNEDDKREHVDHVNEDTSIINDGDLVKSKPQNDEKNQLNKKRKRKSVKKSINSTSDWDIEDIFEKLETKIEKKMKKKAEHIEKNLQRPTKKQKTSNKPLSQRVTKKIDLTLPQQSKKPVIDESLSETTKEDGEHIEDEDFLPTNKNIDTIKTILLESEVTTEKPLNNNKKSNDIKSIVNGNPVELMTAPTNITLQGDDNEEEDDENMIDAFEDDDNIATFTKEKKEEIEQDMPKDINLTLPGWGEWTGPGIQVSKRKKRRFIIRMPKNIPRRDDNKGTLIINEKAQSKIKQHKVSDVPFPFTSVKDFEATLRAPVGSTFVPETAFRKHIKPAVTTKIGVIIEPMSKNILINK